VTNPDGQLAGPKPDVLTVTAGGSGSISGHAFNDNNGNGVEDGGDTAAPGRTVTLDLDADGSAEATKLTDGSGNYSFTGLNNGTYRVRMTLTANTTLTTANPADVLISGGNSVPGINFGLFQTFSISGVVYTDSNANGVKDGSEPGIAG